MDCCSASGLLARSCPAVLDLRQFSPAALGCGCLHKTDCAADTYCGADGGCHSCSRISAVYNATRDCDAVDGDCCSAPLWHEQCAAASFPRYNSFVPEENPRQDPAECGRRLRWAPCAEGHEPREVCTYVDGSCAPAIPADPPPLP